MILQTLAFTILSKKFVGLSSASLGIVAMTVDPMVFSAAAVVVIGAIAAAAVKVINALAGAKRELIELQLQLTGKIDVISGHVDGMRTAAEEKRTARDETIASLTKQLTDSEKRAELLAQARTSVDIAVAVPASPLPTAAPVLEDIKTNTGDTAKNTAKTEVMVKELKRKKKQ